MRIKFTIKETAKGIRDRIAKGLSGIVNDFLKAKVPNVTRSLQPVVYRAIYNCPEMESLRVGSLKADFGLNFDPTDAIAQSVSEAITGRVTRSISKKQSIVGGIEIRIQASDSLNLLTLPESVIITEKGEQLPWLEWLLMYGDTIIIHDYQVEYKYGEGRSGLGIMRKSMSPFRVNPTFSGIQGDNFVSRALNSADTIAAMERSLKSILR